MPSRSNPAARKDDPDSPARGVGDDSLEATAPGLLTGVTVEHKAGVPAKVVRMEVFAK